MNNELLKLRVVLSLSGLFVYVLQICLMWGSINEGNYGRAAFNFMMAVLMLFTINLNEAK